MLLRKIVRSVFIKNTSFRSFSSNLGYKYPQLWLDWKSIILDPENYKNMLKIRRYDDKLEVIDEMVSLWSKRTKYEETHLENLMNSLAFQLPNNVHPDIEKYGGDLKILRTYGEKKEYLFHPLNCSDLLQGKDLMKISNLNLICGERSYFLTLDLVLLEQALLDYTIKKLLDEGFELISVPDILPESIIERCGMPTKGERTQIYKLDPEIYSPELCLSGTSEMAIAAFFMNDNLPAELLPKYYTAVSRCYRAEISQLASEKGIYRVHQFTKVEMFGVCLPHQSNDVFERFCKIQENLFSPFDFHYRIIDMPPHDLGHHAYRKYDIEAWMPGMKKYGEISSCSNCIDYQSRRLNIKSGDNFLHTVNGTACAIPRMISAICETHQNKQGRILIPTVLQPFMEIEFLGMKRGPRNHKIVTHKAPIRNILSVTAS